MLEELRARLKGLNDELKALLETETKDMSGEESGEHFDTIKAKTAEVEKIEGQIETLESAEAARARSAKPANDPVEGTRTPAQPKQELNAADKVGLMVFSMASAYKRERKYGPEAVFDEMDKRGFGFVAEEFSDVQQRALNSGAAADGGVLLPSEMSSEIIDILRPRTTFLQGGPRPISLANGAYKLSAAAAGSTSSWRGEGQAISPSQPTFKDINLTAKFLDSMVPLTNQLIRWSLPDVRGWVQRDMAASMGTALDTAAYFGTGGAHQPLGITEVSGIHSAAATGGTSPTVAQVETDARGLELAMENNNLPMVSTAWVMAPRSFRFLADMRDGNGNRYFPELQNASPMWRGRPVFKTTQVPFNLGVGTNESKILLVNFDDIYFGEGAGMSFGVSTEATYVKDGVTISAFQNDLTLIKASMEADVDMAYLEAVSMLTGVTWGA